MLITKTLKVFEKQIIRRTLSLSKQASRKMDIEESHLVICAAKKSAPVDVEEGKTYYWCSCGRSKSQPFCDGSHKGTEFSPVAFTATETKKIYFCACKQSGKSPLCDGSHKKLPEDAEGKGFPVNYCSSL